MEDDRTEKISLRDFMKRRMNMFLKNANITIRKTRTPLSKSFDPLHQTYDSPPRQKTVDDTDIRTEPLIIENITTLDRRISLVERDVSSIMETVASESATSFYQKLDDIQHELSVIHRDMGVLRTNYERFDGIVAELNSKLETVIRSIGVIDME